VLEEIVAVEEEYKRIPEPLPEIVLEEIVAVEEYK